MQLKFCKDEGLDLPRRRTRMTSYQQDKVLLFDFVHAVFRTLQVNYNFTFFFYFQTAINK